MPVSPLAHRIAAEIRIMIQSRELAEGAHVSAQQLADRFQVSRSPVREALGLLSEGGVLDLRPNRGFFVSESSSREPVSDKAAPPEGDEAYYKLAEDWVSDAIPAEVTEQFLRDRYELTRSRLMDILNRASGEGWVEPKAGYGWRLLPVPKTPEALERLYRFRSIIEPAALLEPTFRLNRQTLDHHKRVQAAMLDGDIERLPANRILLNGAQFHEDLIRMSDNTFLVQALDRVNKLRRLFEYRAMVDRKRSYRQCQEHIEIIGLVERGENVEASQLMRRHLSGALASKSAVTLSAGD